MDILKLKTVIELKKLRITKVKGIYVKGFGMARSDSDKNMGWLESYKIHEYQHISKIEVKMNEEDTQIAKITFFDQDNMLCKLTGDKAPKGRIETFDIAKDEQLIAFEC